MTLREAVASGTSRVRKPYWGDNTYLRIYLHVTPDGFMMSPWARLFAPTGDTLIEVGSDSASDWHLYAGPVRPEPGDQHMFLELPVFPPAGNS